MEKRSTESTEIQKPLGRSIEWHAHAVEHEYNARRSFRHSFDRRLIRQEVTAIRGFLEVNLRAIAFALGIHRSIDATLGAHRMRTFDRNERNQIDRDSRFAKLDHRHEARETSTDDDYPSNFSSLTPIRALGSHVVRMLRECVCAEAARSVRRCSSRRLRSLLTNIETRTRASFFATPEDHVLNARARGKVNGRVGAE